MRSLFVSALLVLLGSTAHAELRQKAPPLPAPTDHRSLQTANQVLGRSPPLAPHAYKVVRAPGPVTDNAKAPVRKSFQPELDSSSVELDGL